MKKKQTISETVLKGAEEHRMIGTECVGLFTKRDSTDTSRLQFAQRCAFASLETLRSVSKAPQCNVRAGSTVNTCA